MHSGITGEKIAAWQGFNERNKKRNVGKWKKKKHKRKAMLPLSRENAVEVTDERAFPSKVTYMR